MKGDRMLCNNPYCPHRIFISNETLGKKYDTRNNEKRKLMCPHCGSTNTENAEAVVVQYNELKQEIKKTNKKDLNLKPMQKKQDLLLLLENDVKSIEKTWKIYEKEIR